MINLIRNTRAWVVVLIDELARAIQPGPAPTRVVVDEVTLPVLPGPTSTQVPARDERATDA